MKGVLYLLGVFLSFTTYAQPGDFRLDDDVIEDKEEIHTNVSIGSQVGTSFNNSFWFSSYIAPSLSYKMSDRFTVAAGIGFSNTQLNNTYLVTNNNEVIPSNGNFNSMFGYVSGIYQLSNNLKVSANYSFENQLNVPADLDGLNQQVQSGSFGVHYKVNRFISLDAQIGVSNSALPNNYGMSNGVLGGNPFNSFYRSPFF